jgi:anaerobic ribonucleoside-triphosphate reductase activating protein
MAADANILRISRFEPRTRANGPGLRAAVWVQGCSLACPGCFNPHTHGFSGGQETPVAELADRIAGLAAGDDGSEPIGGLTVSGGEPFQQRPAVLELLRRVRAATALDTLVFSGFSWDELSRMPGGDRLGDFADAVIAGRYDRDRHLGHALRGSTNKTLHCLTGRLRPEDFEDIPPAEVVIGPDGEIMLAGIDPVRW